MNNKSFSKTQKLSHNIADFLFNKVRFWGSRKIARTITKILLPKLQNATVSHTIFDFSLCLRPGNGEEVYYLGFYEIGTLNVLKQCLKEGDTFLDIGASIGLMSFYASKIVGSQGKILAFEPTKSSFEDLNCSVKTNNTANIQLFNIGLGSESTSIPIYLDRACPSMVKVGNDDSPFEIVKIDKLDDVLKENNIVKVKMAKIDVEGFELEVLKGATQLLTSIDAPIICIEYIKYIPQIKEDGENAIQFIKRINPEYNFYQLTKTSNTISKLEEIKKEEDFHDHDNVFAIRPSHLSQLPTSLFK